MATIIKRGNSYQFKAYGMDIYGQPCRKTMTWTPPPDMTPRQAEKAAERAAAEFENQCKAGKVVDGNITLAQYFRDEWLVNRAPAAEKSRKWYVDMFRRIESHPIAKTTLKAITPPLVNRFYKYLREQCTNEATGNSKAKGKPLSPSTVNSYHKVLRSILTGAVKDGMIETNPCFKVDTPGSKMNTPEVPKREAATMQIDEVNRLIAALAKEPLVWRTLFMMYIFTGARRSELLGLLWDKYNSDTGEITIDHQLSYVEGQPLAYTSTKTGIVRKVGIPPAVIALLGAWYHEQEKWREAVGPDWATGYKRKYPTVRYAPESPLWMFTDEYGNPIHPCSVLRRFRTILIRAGFPQEQVKSMNVHMLRHTCASIMISRNINLATVANQLGHSNTIITQEVYTHHIKQASEGVAQMLEDTFAIPAMIE
ncbi:MAG: site-specific integrase [Oscillospiraceae bacterium]|nr:site-specific integrase [Oscillospiraceae bacterium]